MLADPHLDGDPPSVFVEDIAAAPALGPRQLLLESAPCHSCHQDIPADSSQGLICDKCNRPFHLSCLSLPAPPPTYWYCSACIAHINARGIECPTEDLELQQYLLGNPAPPHLAELFA